MKDTVGVERGRCTACSACKEFVNDRKAGHNCGACQHKPGEHVQQLVSLSTVKAKKRKVSSAAQVPKDLERDYVVQFSNQHGKRFAIDGLAVHKGRLLLGPHGPACQNDAELKRKLYYRLATADTCLNAGSSISLSEEDEEELPAISLHSDSSHANAAIAESSRDSSTSPVAVSEVQKQREESFAERKIRLAEEKIQTQLAKYEIDALVDFTERLGSGSAAVVYLGRYDNQTVAVKVFHQPFKTKQLLQTQECQLMLKLKHTNLITVLGVTQKRDQAGLVLEHARCDFATLSKTVGVQTRSAVAASSSKHPVPDKNDIIRYFIEAMEGLLFLHNSRPPVLHMDVKPKNILIVGNTAKLADFGVAGAITAFSTCTGLPGTPMYMAPECFGRVRPTVKVDVWAAGLTLLSGLTGEEPWVTLVSHPKISWLRIPDGVQAKKLPGTLKLVSQDVAAVIKSALVFDPHCRPLLEDWLNGVKTIRF